MKKSAFKADALLLLAAAIWGFAFVAQRMGMEHVGPFTFNAARFALGSLALIPFVLTRRGRRNTAAGQSTSGTRTPGVGQQNPPANPAVPDETCGVADSPREEAPAPGDAHCIGKEAPGSSATPRDNHHARKETLRPGEPPGDTHRPQRTRSGGSETPQDEVPTQDDRRTLLRAGGLAGCVLFIAVSLQQTGIVYTTAGRAGFITGLYVVIVPILGIFLRQRPGSLAWVGALCATAGMYLLSVTGGLEVSTGDSLVLIGAFFWAAHVMVIGWFIFRTDPLRLALAQSVVCSVLSLTAALLIETIDPDQIRNALLPIIYAGVLSVGVAYTLQLVSQRKAHPGHVVIILSLEAVFAALGGWIILSEVIPARGLVGCGLMLAGAVVSKLGYRSEFTGLSRGAPNTSTPSRY
jgi:drug/metabolite transporter (DMT)-like permease